MFALTAFADDISGVDMTSLRCRFQTPVSAIVVSLKLMAKAYHWRASHMYLRPDASCCLVIGVIVDAVSQRDEESHVLASDSGPFGLEHPYRALCHV